MYGLGALIDFLRDGTLQRTPLSAMDNATIYTANNTTTGIGSNAAGYRIALATAHLVTDTTSFGEGRLNIGTLQVPLYLSGGGGRIALAHLKNLKTPNGATVNLVSSLVNITGYAAAETL